MVDKNYNSHNLCYFFKLIEIHQSLTDVTTTVELGESMGNFKDVLSVEVYGTAVWDVRSHTGLNTKYCAKQ